jgi:hypothetical protein
MIELLLNTHLPDVTGTLHVAYNSVAGPLFIQAYSRRSAVPLCRPLKPQCCATLPTPEAAALSLPLRASFEDTTVDSQFMFELFRVNRGVDSIHACGLTEHIVILGTTALRASP